MLIRKAGDANWRAPTIKAYADERAIQSIIEQSPDLLPGTTSTGMAVASEVSVDAGSIDVLGVDTSGSVTIVECKLRANSEIRRHVIGQVLAYAAGIWGLTYEEFDRAFAARAGVSLAKMVAEFAPEEWDEEAFRTNVAVNLEAGRFQLVIAVDEITEELEQIVRYLNEHTTSDLQVIALELRYVADEGVEILLPQVFGRESVQSKTPASSPRRWDELSLFEALSEGNSAAGIEAARTLYDYAKSKHATLSWGSGPLPSVTARMLVADVPASVFTIYEWPAGRGIFAVNFEYLLDKIPSPVLIRLAERLRSIPGVAERYRELEQSGFKKRPSLPLDEIVSQPGAVDQIVRALDELLASGGESSPAVGDDDH